MVSLLYAIGVVSSSPGRPNSSYFTHGLSQWHPDGVFILILDDPFCQEPFLMQLQQDTSDPSFWARWGCNYGSAQSFSWLTRATRRGPLHVNNPTRLMLMNIEPGALQRWASRCLHIWANRLWHSEHTTKLTNIMALVILLVSLIGCSERHYNMTNGILNIRIH